MSQRNSRMRRAVVVPIGLLVLSGLNLGGCVMSEKYEAEKAAPGAGRKAKRRIGQRSQTEQTRTE